MILGMSTSTFTFFHVLLSLAGIGTGIVVLLGLIAGSGLRRTSLTFLSTTAATSLTGFLFPFKGVTPGIVLGVLSIFVLTLAVVSRYGFGLARGWRVTYVVSASVALYFNLFVLIVQLFSKVAALHRLAPTQSEPAFVTAQLMLLGTMAFLTYLAAVRFRGFRVQLA